MRKRIAMVLLGLSLAVGTPAATNMFPAVSAQTVQAAGKTGWKGEDICHSRRGPGQKKLQELTAKGYPVCDRKSSMKMIWIILRQRRFLLRLSAQEALSL